VAQMDQVNLGSFDLKGHTFDRFFIFDDMHWSWVANGSWPFMWMYGVNSGLCNMFANL
jgi:hypothetical protein